MRKVATITKETRTDLGDWKKRVEWVLLLACGHTAERSIAYRGTQWQQPPTRVQCAECRSTKQ